MAVGSKVVVDQISGEFEYRAFYFAKARKEDKKH